MRSQRFPFRTATRSLEVYKHLTKKQAPKPYRAERRYPPSTTSRRSSCLFQARIRVFQRFCAYGVDVIGDYLA